jgi:hypothetical protein
VGTLLYNLRRSGKERIKEGITEGWKEGKKEEKKEGRKKEGGKKKGKNKGRKKPKETEKDKTCKSTRMATNSREKKGGTGQDRTRQGERGNGRKRGREEREKEVKDNLPISHNDNDVSFLDGAQPIGGGCWTTKKEFMNAFVPEIEPQTTRREADVPDNRIYVYYIYMYM